MKTRLANTTRSWAVAAVLMALLFASHRGFAMTAAALKEKLDRRESVTLIDVRSMGEYRQNHIVGALNVPVDLCADKQLPALGPVVVYGSGLIKEDVQRAVAELNRKPGIQAEQLAGGLAAWEEIKGETTRSGGMRLEQVNWVTYGQVARAPADDVLLVDLREPQATGAKLAITQTKETKPLSDLTKAFPGKRVVKGLGGTHARSLMSAPGERGGGPVLVLIDDGNGKPALDAARMLRLGGKRRVVILVGGEEIVARGGRSGLQRQEQRGQGRLGAPHQGSLPPAPGAKQ